MVSASSFIGDGSQLTGISTDPFPFTGSAEITGSLDVIGPVSLGNLTISGSVNQVDSTNNSPQGFLFSSGSSITSTDKNITILGGRGNSITATGGNWGASIISSRTSTISGYDSHIFGAKSGTASGVESRIFGGASGTATNIRSHVFGGLNADSTGIDAVALGGSGATASGQRAVVVGGDGNTASGTDSGVLAGDSNVASNTNAAVIGGEQNTASGQDSAILAGLGNEANATRTVVVGGQSNTAGGSRSVVLGGEGNETTSDAPKAAIVGGNGNTASHDRSVVVGGDGLSTQKDDEVVVDNLSVYGDTFISSSTLGTGSFIDNLGQEDIPAASGSQVQHIVNLSQTEYDALTPDANTLYVIDGSETLGDTVVSGSLIGEVTALSIASTTASMDCSTGNYFTLTLANGVDTHLDVSNIQTGQTINLKLTNNATAAGTISFGSEFEFEGGTAFTATAATSAVDILTFVSFDGTSLQTVGVKNFS